MKPITAAIIGCGARSHDHVAATRRAGSIEIVYACDTNRTRAEEAATAWGTRPATDHHEVLRDRSLDAAIVVTDVGSHLAIAADVIKAGKHAIVEKPLGSEIEAARDLVALGEAGDQVVYVSYQRRFCAQRVQMKSVAARIDPIQILAVNQRGMMRAQFLNDDPFCGVMDAVCHDIDQVLWFMDRMPLAVTARLRRNSFTRGTGAAEVLSALLEFEDGRSAVVFSSIGAAEIGTRFDVVGTGGNIASDAAGVSAVSFDPYSLRFGEAGGRTALEISGEPSPFAELDLAQQQAFVQEIRTGRKSQAARLKDGLASLLVTLACHRSQAEDRRVPLAELD